MIYITGSNGFVGRNFINFLHKKKKKFTKIKRINLRIRNKSNYEKLPLIKDKRNNYLIHLSSPALVNLYRKKNYSPNMVTKCLENEVGNALSLVHYCKNNKFKKLIYVSTSSIYGPRKYDAPFTEKSRPNPINDYSKIKLKIERLIKKEFKNTIIIRPFQIYGKYDNPNRLIPTLIGAKKNNQIALQNCLQVTDLIHVSDLCEVMYKLLFSQVEFGIYNLGSGRPIKLRTIVELIHELKNKSFKYTYKKTSNNKITNYCYANINSIKKDISWKPKIFFNKKILNFAN